jgi:threonine dehydratase
MDVTIDDIERGQTRIQPCIHHTPLMTNQLINRSVDCELIFKTENLQKIGAFRASGACNTLF